MYIPSDSLSTLVDFLADTLGPKYEIVIYQLNLDGSGIITDIRNSHISKQSIGSSLPEYIRNSLSDKEFKTKPYKEYIVSTSKEGSIVRSSVLYIDNKDNVSDYILAISSFATINSGEDSEKESKHKIFRPSKGQVLPVYYNEMENSTNHNIVSSSIINSESVEETITNKVDETLEKLGIETNNFTFNEKSKIINELCKSEIFKIKGAIQIVSKHLNISESSIYRYIRMYEREKIEDDTDSFLI